MVNIKYSTLSDANPEHKRVAEYMAKSINVRIHRASRDVREKIESLFTSGHLHEHGADAIADLKTIETKLKAEDTLKKLFTTPELRKKYHERFVLALEDTFGPYPNATPPPATTDVYDVSEANTEIRHAIEHLIDHDQEHDRQHAEQHAEHEAHRQHETEEHHDYEGGEEPPENMLTYNPFNWGDFYTWNNWRPFWTKAVTTGPVVATSAAIMSTYEAGSILARTPIISQMGAAGEVVKTSLAALPWMPSAVATTAGVATSTGLALGATYGLGYLWEKLQQTKWYQNEFGTKDVPSRSMFGRLWVGATSPFRLAARTTQYVGKRIWENKGLAIGATALAGLLIASGVATPAGAALLAAGGALVSKAIPEEGGGHDGGDHGDAHGDH